MSLREGADEARALRSPADLREWLRQHPERGALVVWDLGADSVITTVGHASASRPAVALPLLAPALEVLIRPDTVRLGPNDLRRLPGIEPGASDSGAVSVAEVARRAFRGDRAAGDALLHLAGDSAAGPPPGAIRSLSGWRARARRSTARRGPSAAASAPTTPSASRSLPTSRLGVSGSRVRSSDAPPRPRSPASARTPSPGGSAAQRRLATRSETPSSPSRRSPRQIRFGRAAASGSACSAAASPACSPRRAF